MKPVDLAQNTPEWLEWRSHHIGGSDAPAIMFVDAFTDRYRLWQQKTGKIVTPVNKRIAKYETAAERGKRLEPVARQKYCIQFGVFAPAACFENDREGETFMSASVDGYVSNNRIIEIKCPSDGRTHLDAREGQVEPAYQVQMQHCMHVAEVEHCDYVSFYNDDLVVVEVSYNAKFVNDELIPQERIFWQAIQDNAYPLPNMEIMADLTADKEAAAILDDYLKFRRMREDAEEKERIALAQLKRRLIDSGKAKGPGAYLHWEHRRGKIDYQQLPEVQMVLKSGVNLDQYRSPETLILYVERS